ncbi:hypothetical protein Q8A67_020249 [Cirrhinus molitorella]|uniref:Uncharacterized protein n=1 Tax=Cirrhinus molitorella TaxID=172907 RepID=A0AA88TCP2_9TELE|nr:hypothetical protein Q8A67_020249 [Cirrhinus molitorella]
MKGWRGDSIDQQVEKLLQLSLRFVNRSRRQNPEEIQHGHCCRLTCLLDPGLNASAFFLECMMSMHFRCLSKMND